MATTLKITRDSNNYPTTGHETCRVFSNLNQTFALTQNAITTVTVPSNPSSIMMAHFSYTSGANVMVSNVASPAVAIPTTLATTHSELNPVNRVVNRGDTLQFLTDQTGVYVTISYYELMNQ